MITRLTLTLVLASQVAVAQEPVTCPADPMFMVDDAGLGLADRMCTVAVEARQLLEGCSLEMTDPITIFVRPDLWEDYPHCAGVFTCDDDRIDLLPPDLMHQTILEDSPFFGLSAEAYFDSILVHELAHALADQSLLTDAPARADMEYIAYTFQIESLAPAARDMVLAALPVSQPIAPEQISEIVLGFVPHRFALLAWTHFKEEGNGCAQIARLLHGEGSFALPVIGPE